MGERIINFFIKKYFLDYTDVIISIFSRFCKFSLLYDVVRQLSFATRAFSKYCAKVLTRPRKEDLRGPYVRVLEFGRGLSGQIDGH